MTIQRNLHRNFALIALLGMFSCGKGNLRPADRLVKSERTSNENNGNSANNSPFDQKDKSKVIQVNNDPVVSSYDPSLYLDFARLARAEPVQIAVPVECCMFQSQDVFIRRCLNFDVNACGKMNR